MSREAARRGSKTSNKSKQSRLSTHSNASPSRFSTISGISGLSGKTLDADERSADPPSPSEVMRRGSNVVETGFIGEIKEDKQQLGKRSSCTSNTVRSRASITSNNSRQFHNKGFPDAKGVCQEGFADVFGFLNMQALQTASGQDGVPDSDELAVSVEDHHHCPFPLAGHFAQFAQNAKAKTCHEGGRGSTLSVQSQEPKQTSHYELAQLEDDVAELDAEAYCRITPEDLATELENESVQVIDVRSRDFKGGHIPGCQNMLTSSVLEEPGSVIDLCRRSPRVTRVVFTCMYSKLRAPRCATAVA